MAMTPAAIGVEGSWAGRGVSAAANVPHTALQRKRRIFVYGVSRDRVERAVRELGADATTTKDWKNADLIVTLRAHEKRFKSKTKGLGRDVPVFFVRGNTYSQVYSCLREALDITRTTEEAAALEEARVGISRVLNLDETVELSPQNSYVRRLQHQLARAYQLVSRSVGKEPHRRVVLSKG